MNAKEYKVMAANSRATYTAGRYCGESAADACDMAREAYRRTLGRELKDVGSFRFYVVDHFPHEAKGEIT